MPENENCKHAEKLEPWFIDDKIVNLFSHCEKQFQSSSKYRTLNNYLSKSIENICPHKNMFTNFHRSIIYNDQKMNSPMFITVKQVNKMCYIHCCYCCSVTQLCLTLCDPMVCTTPGFPVHHHLPELAQTHVHWFGDAIQPSHLLSFPSPPAFNLSKHQGLF